MNVIPDATKSTYEQQPEAAAPRNDATQIVAHGQAFLSGRPIGEILRTITALTPEKLEEALTLQAEKGGRLGEVLVGIKAVSEEDVAKALGLQLDLPFLQRIFVV